MSGERNRWMPPLAFLAGVFGVATIVSGGRVPFDPEAARVSAVMVIRTVFWGVVALVLTRPGRPCSQTAA